jgi:hypothetical protein
MNLEFEILDLTFGYQPSAVSYQQGPTSGESRAIPPISNFKFQMSNPPAARHA